MHFNVQNKRERLWIFCGMLVCVSSFRSFHVAQMYVYVCVFVWNGAELYVRHGCIHYFEFGYIFDSLQCTAINMRYKWLVWQLRVSLLKKNKVSIEEWDSFVATIPGFSSAQFSRGNLRLVVGVNNWFIWGNYGCGVSCANSERNNFLSDPGFTALWIQHMLMLCCTRRHLPVSIAMKNWLLNYSSRMSSYPTDKRNTGANYTRCIIHP